MNLLSIDDLGDRDIAKILAEGQRWFDQIRGGHSGDTRLDGRVIVNAFFENSTRTVLSFAIAAHRLGADVVSLQADKSSVKKGETLEDTARTLGAMRPDAIVIRHGRSGAAADVATLIDCPVINAGDGTNEHPTQALLDAATLRRRFGQLAGLTIAICGDIRHSRVARSNAKLLRRLGATVRLAGPPMLMPEGIPALSVDEAIEGADAVMMLRVQRERLDDELGDAPGEFLSRYGLTAERLARAAPNALVMHPGPVNRGVEIDGAIADDPQRSLILDQVEMGVAIRMACLDLLIGTRGR